MARKKPQRTSDGFLLNEPTPAIPGGMRRKSVTLGRADLAAIERREQLNRLLLAHDLEKPTSYLPALGEEDLTLLRQMAKEGTIANQVPAIRYQAIQQLGRYPTTENLNLLEELARQGEDVYVRSHALLALGNSGVKMAGAVLREGLAAAHSLEKTAAFRGLTALGQSTGVGVIHALQNGERRSAVVDLLKQIASQLTQEPPKARPKKRQTTVSQKMDLGGDR
jgi:HEAT repeat protein